jgi:transmembrane sensor
MTVPADDLTWERLTGLLAGTLSPDEAARVEAWVAEDATRQELLESLRVVWAEAAAARPMWDARAAIQTIKSRANTRPIRRRGWVPLAAAAAIAALCAGGWLIMERRLHDGATHPAPVAMMRYETSRGQRLGLKLPDGSAVMLAPESELRYSSAYGQQNRTVELAGEAYFQVPHDTVRPFEVRTHHAVARDLGTRFAVRARDTASMEVVVAEGLVAVGRAVPSGAALTDSVVLAAHDLGRVTAPGAITHRRGVWLDLYLGWTEGRLVFEAAPLADVVADLSRWYDVDIHLSDERVSKLRLTATFRDQPITEILSLIRASLGVTVTGAGRHFTIAAD